MRRLALALPLAVFFLDPSFACGPSSGSEYRFDATEMRSAVEGSWSFSIAPDGGGAPVQVTVKMEQAAGTPTAAAGRRGRGLVRAAQACGTRTLVKSASACTDVTEMPLTVTFVAGDAAFSSAPMSGTFTVYGYEFVTAAQTSLEIVLGPYHVHAQVEPDGTVDNPRIGPEGAAGSLTIVTRS
jgi:hypothetical protein